MKLRLFQKETVLGEAEEGGYGRLHLGQKPRAGTLAMRELSQGLSLALDPCWPNFL